MVVKAIGRFLGITGQTGNKKSRPKSGGGKYLQYPIRRSSAESEDSLLIKAMEYISPNTAITNRDGTGRDDASTLTDKVPLGSGITATLNTSSVVRNKKTKEIIRVNKELNFVNPGGMDARINAISTSDPGGFREKIKYYVELPIPQQINDSNAVSWGEDSLNVLEAAAFNVASNAAQGGIEGLGERFESARQAIFEGNTNTTFPGLTDDVRRGLVAALSGKAVSALGGNISSNSALGRSTGQILNSNLELLFQGLTLRTFPFNITFSPRSRDESDRVKLIIRKFKQSMAAKTGRTDYAVNGGIFLKAPDIFRLKYLSNGRTHPFLNSFKPCALTNMSVNYTGAGTYSTYSDGTPVNIKLSLTFKEINPIYAEDYDEDNLFGNDSGEGVGF